MNMDLAGRIDLWHRATDNILAVAATIDATEQDKPTQLPGWTVSDVLAHVAHLEAICSGAPEETIDVGQPDHVRNFMGAYTEQGVVARKTCSVEDLATEIDESHSQARQALIEQPPTPETGASPLHTPGGVDWSAEQFISNRGFDVFMHDLDIRHALGRDLELTGQKLTDTEVIIEHVMLGLPKAFAKKVQPAEGATLKLVVPELDKAWLLSMSDSKAALAHAPVDAEATAAISLSVAELVGLLGGRCTPEQASAEISGDAELAAKMLASMIVVP